MRSTLIEQMSKLLKDHNKRSRRMSMVLCLALVVTAGTFYTLMRQGQAMVHTEKVLQCPYTAHVHTVNCGGGLTCGVAEYAFHTHGDFCFDAEGGLVCTLPEIPAHVHDETCWKTEQVQICGQESSAGHQHTEACYPLEVSAEDAVSEMVPAAPVCGLEEHAHTDACYSDAAGEPVLICGQEMSAGGHSHDQSCYGPDYYAGPDCGEEERHVHSLEAGCYQMRPVCGREENGDHFHASACYAPVTVCGKEENHIHTPEAGCYETQLTCGLEEDGEHFHTDMCYSSTLLCILEERHFHTEDCFLLACQREGNHVHTDACYPQTLTCGLEETPAHVHTDACYMQAAGARELTCGQQEHTHSAVCFAPSEPADSDDMPGDVKPAVQPICGMEESEGHTHEVACFEERTTLTCTTPGVHTHTAACRDENGQLICGQLQIEEHVHGAACLIDVEVDDGVTGTYICGKAEHIHDLFCTLTFCSKEEHVHGPECLFGAEEIPEIPEVPAGPGGPEDSEYPEDSESPEDFDDFEEPAEPELPEGKTWACRKVSHRHDRRICYNASGELVCEREEHTHTEECLPPKEPEPVQLNEEHLYITEDGLFTIRFHVTGEALLPVEEAVPAASGGTAYMAETGGLALQEDGISAAAEPELVFTVTALDRNSYDYVLFYQQAEEQEEQLLSALSISITCGGRELDISKCVTTAEITPTGKLLQTMLEPVAAISEGGEEAGTVAGLRLTAYEKKSDIAVEALDTVYINSASTPETAGQRPDQPEDLAAQEAEGTVTMSLLANAAPFGEEDAAVDPQLENYTMTVQMQGNDLAVTGRSSINPEFTVQFYAYVQKVKMSESTKGTAASVNVPVLIDTRRTSGAAPEIGGPGIGLGGNLPSNLVELPYVTIQRNGDGTIQYDEVLTEIFRAEKCIFDENPSLEHFNVLPQVNHYTLSKIWVLKAGRTDTASINPDDWDEYPIDATYTNNPEAQSSTCIYIGSGTVIRIIYERIDSTYENDVTFYDYDISDGEIYTDKDFTTPVAEGTDRLHQPSGAAWYQKTGQFGINSAGNYGSAGSSSMLAFGNGHSVAGVEKSLSDNKWGSYYLNQANSTVFGKCSFGIAGSLVNEKIQFNVSAPNLFNEGEAEGKSDPIYADLVFKRSGDTYTLTAVKGTQASASDLDKLSLEFPGWAPGGVKPLKWANRFWPLDASTETWGTEGHDMKFGNISLQDKRWGSNGIQLPATDESVDGATLFGQSNFEKNIDHNAYFGMNFAVNFKIPKNYVGPLEYIFFGDDDMWVFLSKDGGRTGTLVCDIGGVHPAMGEYVNLWNYISESELSSLQDGQTADYTLYFFYTERGASGSCCWMQFTLPDISAQPIKSYSGSMRHTVRVSKDVEGPLEGTDQVFKFQLQLTGTSNAANVYNYAIYHKNGTAYTEEEYAELEQRGYQQPVNGGTRAIKSEDFFYLKSGDYIDIKRLPEGTSYTIQEVLSDEEKEIYELVGGEDNTGVIVKDGEASGGVGPTNSSLIQVSLINKSYPVLPETAGPGTASYILVGAGLALFAGGVLLLRRRRGDRG